MANFLVPYKQDEDKWRQHYLEQAMKQFKEKDMLKQHKDQELHPQYVHPLVAQAESELKRQKKELPVTFAFIKATPEFENHTSSLGNVKQTTSNKRNRSPIKQVKYKKE